MYSVPEKYYFRLHHVRPRFKNEVESVLGYVAFSIAQIGRAETSVFKDRLCRSIRQYGVNAASTQKTIDNWRTEIGALFGMYVECPNGYTMPTHHSIDLANTSNLQAFFTGFVYSFQYPGGHIKPRAIDEILDAGVSFHPYHWLFGAFLHTDLNTIDKCEFCHCVLNDMRVTRDHEPVQATVDRIITNRHNRAVYNSEGDVVRYACDLLDYAVLAGLLNEHEGRFSINNENKDIVEMIASATNYYDAYEKLRHRTLSAIGERESEWFTYVDKCYQESKQKVEQIVASRIANRRLLQSATPHSAVESQYPIQEQDGIGEPPTESQNESTTDAYTVDTSEIATIDENDVARIGDYGENMILQHECLRVVADGRGDLVHLIKRIPTHFAVGYDVKSIETDTEFDRFIEVKTTKSKKPLMFKQIHLTTNEWRTAQSSGNKYCVYRLMISDEGCKLFVIRDPVQKFRDNLITIIPRDGMDISFTDASGEEVELLCVH